MNSTKYTLYIGEHISGALYPSLLKDGEVLSGVKVASLTGFVEFLELHMGLRSPRSSESLQIETYLQSLKKNKEKTFYKASFEADPYTVAQDLFRKRKELMEAGYDFSKIEEAPSRFKDLGVVEKDFSLTHSLPDRALVVLEYLSKVKVLPVEQVYLLKPLEEFPVLYRNIFQSLSNLSVKIIPPEYSKLVPVVKAIKVKNEFDAASVISELHNIHPEIVSYIRSGNEILDLMLQVDGQASLGSESSSRARPLLQMILLASELLWDPLDPRRVIEFLSLPIKPLGRKLSSRLGEALTQAPGFGGMPWIKAIEEYFELEKDQEQKFKNEERLNFLFNRKRHPKSGAPIEDVSEFFRFIGNFLKKRQSFQEGMVVDSILSLLNLMANRSETISKLDLERLLENNLPAIAFGPCVEQVNRIHTFSSPENIRGKLEKLIWHPFCELSSGESFFWSQDEEAYLRSHGVKLLRPHEKIKLQMEMEIRLLNSVEKEVFLIIPETLHGAVTSEHPFIHQLKITSVPASEYLRSLQEEIPRKKLPTPKGAWKIKNASLLKDREAESYSSLEKLFHYPWIYLLQYQAKLQGQGDLSLGDEFKLRGLFAHKVFEEYFTEHKKPELMRESGKWFDENINRLIDQYGIIWRQEGEETALAKLRSETRRGLVCLCQHLIENNWSVDEVEKNLSGKVFGQNFRGSMDMALMRGEEKCVLDLKYAGKKYKEMLDSDEDLQLALYSKIYGEGAFTYTGYYIISTAHLYSKDDRAFKKPHNRPTDSFQERYKTLWSKMDETHKVRRQELASGEIVVRDELTEDLFQEKLLDDPEIYLDMSNKEGDRYHEYSVLLGFGGADDEEED